jgi:pimeloyl-ACP methyl ester carboxylesterase
MKLRFLATAAAVLAAGTVCLSAQPDELEYRYFDSDGVQIAFAEKGRGEPVILLHAGLADSEMNWLQLGTLNALAGYCRAIAMDFRGHGKSGKPHDPQAYGRLMARGVLGLMDHLKITKAHLLGYSMGSLIALTLVADHPNRVVSATFGGPGWIRPGKDLSIYKETAESLEAGQGLGPLLNGYSGSDGKPLPEGERIKLNADFAARNDMAAIAAVFRSIADLVVLEEQLRSSPVPCLFLFGTRDDKPSSNFLPNTPSPRGAGRESRSRKNAARRVSWIIP